MSHLWPPELMLGWAPLSIHDLRGHESAAARDAPDHLAAEVANGDTVILLSRAPFRGQCVADAAALAMRIGDPWALAQRLAEPGFTTSEAPYAAVAVLRLEPAS